MANTSPRVRTNRTTIHVEPSEREAWDELAARHGTTLGRLVSAWIREAAEGEGIHVKPAGTEA